MVSSWVKHIKICITSVYLSLRVTCLGEPMAASQSPNCSNANSAFGEKLFATEVSGSSQYAGKCLPQPLLNQKLNGEERLQFQVNLGIIICSWNELHALPHQWKNGKIERDRDWFLSTCILRTILTLVSQEGTKPQPTLHYQGDLLFLPLVLTANVPWGRKAKKGLTGQQRILFHSNQVLDNGWHSDNWKLAEKLVQAGLSGCKCGLGYLGVLKKKSSLQYFRVEFWDFLFCLIH